MPEKTLHPRCSRSAAFYPGHQSFLGAHLGFPCPGRTGRLSLSLLLSGPLDGNERSDSCKIDYRRGARISTVVSIRIVLETVSVSYSGLFPEISQSRFFRSSIPSPFWAEMGKISCFGKRAFMALRYISDSSKSILLATMSHWRSPSSSS